MGSQVEFHIKQTVLADPTVDPRDNIVETDEAASATPCLLDTYKKIKEMAERLDG